MSVALHIPRGWNAKDIPDQTGKRFLITGGTSGIGKEAARELARNGAHVTITARSARKAEAVLKEIAEDRLNFVELDLTVEEKQALLKSAAEVKEGIQDWEKMAK